MNAAPYVFDDEDFITQIVEQESPALAARLTQNALFRFRVWENYTQQFDSALGLIVSDDPLAGARQVRELVTKAATERAAKIMREECEHFLRCTEGVKVWTEETPEVPDAEHVRLEEYV